MSDTVPRRVRFSPCIATMIGLPLLARNRNAAMSAQSPLSGVKRKLDFEAVRSVEDPQQKLALVQRRPDML